MKWLGRVSDFRKCPLLYLAVGDLKSGLAWTLFGQKGLDANGLDFEWDLKFWKPNHLKSGQMAPFCQKPFEVQTNIS